MQNEKANDYAFIVDRLKLTLNTLNAIHGLVVRQKDFANCGQYEQHYLNAEKEIWEMIKTLDLGQFANFTNHIVEGNSNQSYSMEVKS